MTDISPCSISLSASLREQIPALEMNRLSRISSSPEFVSGMEDDDSEGEGLVDDFREDALLEKRLFLYSFMYNSVSLLYFIVWCL